MDMDGRMNIDTNCNRINCRCGDGPVNAVIAILAR